MSGSPGRYLEAIEDRIRDFRAYLALARSWFSQNPGFSNLCRLIRWYFRWNRYQRRSRMLIDAAEPWLAFSCSDFLRKQIRQGWKVFEYGSGGSSLFFALHGAAGVSVEHDTGWAQKVQEKLREAGAKWQVLIVPSEAGLLDSRGCEDPSGYRSSFPGFEDRNFKKYAETIDSFPKASFDLVIVDGRARPSCLLHGAAKVRPGGFLILDDSQRERYQAVIKILGPEWKRTDFTGPKPQCPDWPQTTLWQYTKEA